MKIILIGPSFTACRQLLEALEEKGIPAAIGQAGHPPEEDGDNGGSVVNIELRQIVLAPPELPFGFPLPKTEYIHVNSERELAAQVAAVIQELEWRAA